jgi:hypothetical protein
MSWAFFHVVEVMASSKFQYKRLGYLAAAKGFQQDTEVLMLCTNQIKKVRFTVIDSRVGSSVKQLFGNCCCVGRFGPNC